MRKASPVSSWGNRNHENRVEPIAQPAFDVPFRLEPREAIFTIGSCFARNIEDVLAKRGFRIPMRSLFKTEAFAGLEFEIVNNFGTPSIYNELAWAFGEQEFDYDLGFYEVAPGKFVDLQMVPAVRPAPLELVRARRDGLLRVTREMAQCRVVIMTLGLVELWWDEEAGVYLNSSPLRSILQEAPERFSLHVLNFDECYGYLKSAFDVMFRHGRDDLRVILTVSPVPMMSTHRRIDVITANTYSKSVLRAVAEHLVEEDERITYFPSYETVMLSNRKASFADDLVHVTRPMVGLNVERMLAAFTEGGEPAELSLPDLGEDESAQAILLAEQARRARLRDDGDFFEQHRQAAETSPRFAGEYARYLFEQKRYRAALEMLGDDESSAAQWLRADIHMALEEYDEVLRIAEEFRKRGTKGAGHWKLMLDAHEARRDREGILGVEALWADTDPRNEAPRLFHVGRALRKAGEPGDALDRLERIIDDPQLQPASQIELVRALIAAEHPDRALKALKTIQPETHVQERQLKKLKSVCQRKKRAIAKTRKKAAGKAE